MPHKISQENFSIQADVVIIGAGIVGCCAAYRLAKRGISVALCEKGCIAGEQSSRNWGWVRQQGRDARELPLMIESRKIWQSLQNEIGEDLGYRQTGCSYLAENDKQMQELENWMDIAKTFELDSQLLDKKGLGKHFPAFSKNWKGALFTPSDGRAEPAIAAPAIAKAAEKLGVIVLTNCAVRGIETQAGNVASVVTENGAINTQTVISAAGAWSSLFCRNLGITLPQLQVKGSVVRTAPAPNIINGAIWGEPIALRRRLDEGYTIAHGMALEHFIVPDSFRFFRSFLPGFLQSHDEIRLRINGSFYDHLRSPKRWPLDQISPFEQHRVLDPKPSEKILKELTENIAKYLPELANIPIVESWAGMIEATPDAIPVLSATQNITGLFIAAGLSGHGFGLGPGAGYAVADLATGQQPPANLSAFKLSRFSDGSKLELGPGI